MSKALLRNYPYVMLLPGCLVFLVFFIVPTLQGVYYSFTNWNGFEASWVGFDNFISFFQDRDLSKIVKNTLVFTAVTTFFKVGLGIAAAVFLNRKLKTKYFLQTVIFSPAILSNVAVGLMFVAILHPEAGLVNKLLNGLGLDFLAMDWLHDRRLALYGASSVEIWKWTGFNMVILLAGLQTIPRDFYEAADTAGASAWQKFRHITLPLLMPAINNVLVLNLIGGLKVFDMIAVTTNGGPGTATEVINTWIYKAYGSGLLGQSSAGSVVLAVLVTLVSLSTYYVLRKREVEL
ncbi:carbohydrate ABC transporter permease [Cohnella sp.]|uniref:carbohydrate ABC transporter permease n=1 Tax=Cohnella sp. TaxID=1883426 RepID=UPI003562CDFB